MGEQKIEVVDSPSYWSDVQPLAPIGVRVPPHAPTRIATVGKAKDGSFTPRRLVLSGNGTSGGAADWVVHDVKVNGISRLRASMQNAPGDAFSKEMCHFDGEAFNAEDEVALMISYIGPNENGCVFYGALTGHREGQERPKRVIRYDNEGFEIDQCALCKTDVRLVPDNRCAPAFLRDSKKTGMMIEEHQTPPDRNLSPTGRCPMSNAPVVEPISA